MNGLPQVLIEFKTKAETIITRSQRGIVAIIVKDNSVTTFDTKIYTKESDILVSHYTTANRDYLAKVFLGNPAKVIVERVGTTDDYTNALARLSNKAFNYLAIPGILEADVAAVVTWIKAQRDDYKKTYKAVLPNIAADYEGIINFTTTDIKIGLKTYTGADYTARIAGILAGTPLNQSCTYYALTEVESITESLTPDADVDAGKLILINDGSKIKIGRGVNSLVTTTATKGSDFKKIKIVDGIDLIRDDVRSTFEDNFIGKIINSYDNKVLFIAAVNNYFKNITAQGVLYDQYDNKAEIDIVATAEWLMLTKDISDWEETQIKQANTGSNVFVSANIQLQDAIEDLKFTIYI